MMGGKKYHRFNFGTATLRDDDYVFCWKYRVMNDRLQTKRIEEYRCNGV